MNIFKRVLYTIGLIKDPVFVAHIADYAKYKRSISLPFGFGGSNDPYMSRPVIYDRGGGGVQSGEIYNPLQDKCSGWPYKNGNPP